jgi:ubiquinol-cytochrome c reductase cytochrome c1 subunit
LYQAIAAKADIIDGPNDAGEMFTRPGRLADCFPSPYPNDEAARAANNGALPPDFSLIAQARHGNADYLFALLTGYTEPPAGVSIMKGQYYNAYFPGGAISMPPPIMDGQVDYPDGTPNSASQLAKDVSTFLTWASDPTQDQRKLAGCKAVFAMGACALLTFWYKRFKWNVVKTRKIYWAVEVKTAQASAMKQQ